MLEDRTAVEDDLQERRAEQGRGEDVRVGPPTGERADQEDRERGGERFDTVGEETANQAEGEHGVEALGRLSCGIWDDPASVAAAWILGRPVAISWMTKGNGARQNVSAATIAQG